KCALTRNQLRFARSTRDETTTSYSASVLANFSAGMRRERKVKKLDRPDSWLGLRNSKSTGASLLFNVATSDKIRSEIFGNRTSPRSAIAACIPAIGTLL